MAVLPMGVGWRQIARVGAIAGIGFSVSIFITDLAFGDSPEAVWRDGEAPRRLGGCEPHQRATSYFEDNV